MRKASYQVVDCPKCGRDVFVLGCSVYQSPPPEALSVTVRAWPRWWYYSVGITVGVLVGLFMAFWWLLPPVQDTTLPAPEKRSQSPPISITELLQQVRAELAVGNYALAHQHLKTNQPQPSADTSPANRSELKHLRKETAIYADLLDVSLEALVDDAANWSEEEWTLRFGHRYQGKSVLFQTTIHRSPPDTIHANYLLYQRGKPVRLAVSDLNLFNRLELDEPQQVLFGARLQAVKNTSNGWAIHFQPDSGVFLTEPAPLSFSCPALNDDDTKALLSRQKSHLSLTN